MPRACAVVLLALVAAAPDAQTVGTYTYDGPGSVNTFWIDAGDSLVVVDVQRDLDHAREALAAVRAVGKPVAAVLITHGHPDHYTGLGLFKEAFPEAVAYASPVTDYTIREDPYGFNAYVQELTPEAAPDAFVPADRVFGDGATLRVGGVEVVTREMGPAEANSATVFYLPATGDLFAGDLVLNRMHGFFLDERSDAQLAVLDRVRVLFPNVRTLHPGHGPAGPAADLLDRQRDYIVTARALAASEIAAHGVTDEGETRVAAALRARYPDHGRPAGQPDMIELSVAGLFAELAHPDERPVR